MKGRLSSRKVSEIASRRAIGPAGREGFAVLGIATKLHILQRAVGEDSAATTEEERSRCHGLSRFEGEDFVAGIDVDFGVAVSVVPVPVHVLAPDSESERRSDDPS